MPPKRSKNKTKEQRSVATTEENSKKQRRKKQERSKDVKDTTTADGSGADRRKKKRGSKNPSVEENATDKTKPVEIDKTVMSERLIGILPLVDGFCRRVLDRKDPVIQLIKEFREEKRSNDFTKMTAFTQNIEKNRYKDVGCLDNNRVELTFGKATYIHANFVGFPNSDPKKFICTQGPLPETIEDFWSMIWQEGCRCIIMLCNYLEKNAKKCAEYLPKSPAQPLELGQMKISLINKGAFPFQAKTKTNVVKTEVEVVVGEKRMTVVHLHWLDWPDRGVPPADSAPIEVVNDLQNYRGNPVVVHCSAGIGRTGSLVLIDMLIEQFNNRIAWKPDLRSGMVEMRKQRNNSVQTEHQYLYVHQVMLNFLRTERALPADLLKLHDVFTAEYEKTCKGF